MTDRPIPFSAPMVRALLDGRKTQTRRVLNKAAALDAASVFGPNFLLLPGNVDLVGYALRDRLYVREAWRAERALDHLAPRDMTPGTLIRYEADHPWVTMGRYRHARFMPRWASRLTLIVTDVRVQRLQEISEADARAEGATAIGADEAPDADERSHRWGFINIWNSLHGPAAWDANPWVVALTFTVAHGNIDALGAANA